MGELELIRQGETVLYPGLIFNRPANPIAQPIVSLIGGNVSSFKPLADAYAVASGLGTRVEVITPSHVAHSLSAATTSLVQHQFDPNDKATTQALWEQVDVSASLAVVGIGLALSSALQVRLEELLNQVSLPVMLVGPSLRLFATNQTLIQRNNLIICCDTIELVRLLNDLQLPTRLVAERGVYGVLDLVQPLGALVPALRMIVFDAENLLIYDQTAPQQAGLLHIDGDWFEGRGLIYGAVAAMLSWPLRRLDNFVPRALNAAYVLRALTVNEKTAGSLNRRTKQIYEVIT